MTKTNTRIWDPAEHLQSDEDISAYLEAALEEGDASLFAAALGDIARAKGMSQLAKETGLGRESLYKALSPTGNPEFATILRVVGALGLKLHATSAPAKSVGIPDKGALSGRRSRSAPHLKR
jgi:probable addiction module antidote protein